MLYRQLGKSDLRVSVIGFGCWAAGNDWTNSNDQDSISAIHAAVDEGINFFDVAPVYGFGHAEQVLGKALQGRRDKVYVASKCGLVWNDTKSRITRDLSRRNIEREIDESLQRLNIDYLDLYQIHWPDPNTPLEETMETLAELKNQGKIRNVGVTNFNVSLLEQARMYVEIASNQVLYNMIDRNSDIYHALPLTYRTEQEIIPYCEQQEIGVIPYSPLCQGLLTDEFDRRKISDQDVRVNNPQLNGKSLDRNLAVANQLRSIAQKYGRPLVELAFNWLVRQEAISTIIAGATNKEQITANVRALKWQLASDDIREIQEILAS